MIEIKRVLLLIPLLLFISCQDNIIVKDKAQPGYSSNTPIRNNDVRKNSFKTKEINEKFSGNQNISSNAEPTINTISLCSWNLLNFGSTKSDAEVDFIANTVKGYDIVLVQEVVAVDAGGAQAVSRLAAVLNRKGEKWNYAVSDPTVSSAYKTERYAYLWQASRVSLVGKPWLEQQYKTEIDREPYYASFKVGGRSFTLANFHAITKSKQPETEVKYFKFLPAQYPGLNIIFCGDFNLPQSHTVFNPLKKMGYKPALTGQKTSLKQECIRNDCLASEFDNFFFNTGRVSLVASGAIHFYRSFADMHAARKISDHLPVFFKFRIE